MAQTVLAGLMTCSAPSLSLPAHLATWLDQADHGIYFTLISQYL